MCLPMRRLFAMARDGLLGTRDRLGQFATEREVCGDRRRVSATRPVQGDRG